MLHRTLREPGASFEQTIGRRVAICVGYRIEKDLETYPGTSALLAKQRYCGSNIATASIADNGDARSIDAQRGGIFRNVFCGGVPLLDSDRKPALWRPAKFDDHYGCADANSKLARETIMGG
jgi:hypothetical protein